MKIREWDFPDELYYDEHHQWVKFADGEAWVGLTSFGQSSRGDVLYIQLPEVGLRVRAGDAVASIETGKWIGRIFSPCDGVITEVNAELVDAPGQVNADPYGAGWIFKFTETTGVQRSPLLQGDAFRMWADEEIEAYFQEESADGQAPADAPTDT